jgi:hypothetical protein
MRRALLIVSHLPSSSFTSPFITNSFKPQSCRSLYIQTKPSTFPALTTTRALPLNNLRQHRFRRLRQSPSISRRPLIPLLLARNQEPPRLRRTSSGRQCLDRRHANDDRSRERKIRSFPRNSDDFFICCCERKCQCVIWECGLELECRWQDSGKEWIRGSGGGVVSCGFSLILKGID